MAFKLDGKGLFELASAFGDEGIRFALEATEGAVRVASETAKGKLRSLFAIRWPTSKIRDNIEINVSVSRAGVVGTVAVAHKWVEVLMLGKDVPMRRGNPLRIELARKRNATGKEARAQDGVIFRTLAKGYKGFNAEAPAIKVGERKLQQLIQKVALKLAQKLSKGK